MYCFVHGYPTHNASSWIPHTEGLACGHSECACRAREAGPKLRRFTRRKTRSCRIDVGFAEGFFLTFPCVPRFKPLCGASRVVAPCRALCITFCAPFGRNKTDRHKFRTRRERCRLLSAGMACLVGSVRASKKFPYLFYPQSMC